MSKLTLLKKLRVTHFTKFVEQIPELSTFLEKVQDFCRNIIIFYYLMQWPLLQLIFSFQFADGFAFSITAKVGLVIKKV